MKVLLIDQIAKVNYKYSYSLANSVFEQGIDINMVIDKKEDNQMLKCPYTNMFNTDEKNISKVSKLINYYRSWKKILSMLDEGYDLIHIQWVIFSPLDYYFLKKIKKKNKKIVFTIHDILPFNKKCYDYPYYKKMYNLVDALIIQTKDNINKFHELFPDNHKKVDLVPHGHFLNFARVLDKECSRKELNMKNKFTFLFFGQIKDVKGVDILLEAYATLLRDNTDMREHTQLVIAGSVWKSDYSKCERIIEENKMGDSVIQKICYIPDDLVDVYYSASDVCVLPYKEVYQSGVLQLTYAHQKAPIVTDIPAFLEIVDDEKGFICKANDVESLAEAMKKAYDAKAELGIMANKGYQFVDERYNWSSIANKIIGIYTKMYAIEEKKL